MDWFQTDPKQWAATQFGEANLGDKRRTNRLLHLAKQVVGNPSGSFPNITECWADLKAAYRLFDEEEVTFQAVATPHWHRTRACPPGRYLVIGDTTEFDWGPGVEGLAPTGNGGGHGFWLHSALVVAAESEAVVGLAGQEIHYRKPVPKGETRTQRLARERESDLWGNSSAAWPTWEASWVARETDSQAGSRSGEVGTNSPSCCAALNLHMSQRFPHRKLGSSGSCVPLIRGWLAGPAERPLAAFRGIASRRGIRPKSNCFSSCMTVFQSQ